jgi:hypothetical protein
MTQAPLAERIVAKGQSLGLSERATQAIALSADTDAEGDALLADAKTVAGLFRCAAGMSTALREAYDLDVTRDNVIVAQVPIAQVRAEILQKMAELSPDIDTAPRAGSMQNVSEMDQMAHDHYEKRNAARGGNEQ